MRSAAIRLAALLFAAPVVAAEPAPYAGWQDRPIAALSAEDRRALAAGEGWGLALPAELNGWPGPLHVLDDAETLALSDEQTAAVKAIYERMNAEARAAGADYMAAEAALDAAFAEGDPDAPTVARLTAEAGAALAALRAVHLAAHLETTPLLTRRQRHVYADLRGYDDAATDHKTHGRGHD
jgi:hypothetical protein